MSRLMAFFRPYGKAVALAALLGFCTISGNVGLMATSAYLISEAALHPEIQALSIAIVGVRFFGIARAVSRYAERYVSHDVTFRLLKTLRVWLYSALEPLVPARLLAYRSGDLLSRIVADVETLKFLYLKVLAPPLVANLTALVMFIWFALAYPLLLLPVLVLGYGLIGVVVPAVFHKVQQNKGRQVLYARARLNAALVDTLQGLTEIRAYDRTLWQQERIGQLAQQLHQSQDQVAVTTAWAESATVLVSQLTMALALTVAIPLITAGQIQGVHLAVIALAVQSSFEAFLPLPMMIHHWEESRAAARRLFELIDAKPAVDESPTALYCNNEKAPNLNICSLNFSYLPGQPVLKEFNLHIKAGKKVALVGASGAGKSTLVDVLLRFFDYQQGSILLDNQELKDYDVTSLRKSVGLVAQKTHLFNTSVRHNLGIAKSGALEEELWEALKKVKLDQFIQSLPLGLDTPVGQNGLSLSGGQRQRIALARVLIEQPKLLIFDEATVGLDAVTEKQVLEALETVMENKTVLYITHRLIGLEKFDQIAVLQDGHIIELGSQAQLLAQAGVYSRLWHLQRSNMETW